MRLQPGLCAPGPTRGAYNAPPGPLAGYRRGMETAREGKERKGRRMEFRGVCVIDFRGTDATEMPRYLRHNRGKIIILTH